MSRIVEDFKSNGLWVRSYMQDGYQYYTQSGKRWSSLISRCSLNGSYQNKHTSYIGCENKFKNFQSFVEWSSQQKGFNGESWHLDKDILVKGNKIYSPDTCCLVPLEINSLFIRAKSRRGDYPIGVSFQHNEQKFVAKCNAGGLKVYLGYFEDPMQAFNAYKNYKELYIKRVADKWNTL